MQAKSLSDEEVRELKKNQSKFDNPFLDVLYNIIAYIPAAIITWFVSNLE